MTERPTNYHKLMSDWRVPSIMELSLIARMIEIQGSIPIWSRTAHITKFNHESHWAVSYSQPNLTYMQYQKTDILRCIFVRHEGNHLYWSGVFRSSKYEHMLEKLELVKTLGTPIRYKTNCLYNTRLDYVR